jgi:hypothetical protein
MVGQEVVLCDLSVGFFVVVISFIPLPLCPDFVVVKLSKQKVDMLSRVIHGRSPLVLKIFLSRKKTAITRQLGQR